MSKKRKSEISGLDEAERSLYSSFSAAAVSISTLYTQAQSQQKLAFQAGERHAVVRLHQFISRESHGGAYISVEQLLAHLQRELDKSWSATLATPPSNNGGGVAFDPSKASGSEGPGLHLSSPQRRSVGAFAAALIAPSCATGSEHGRLSGHGAHAVGGEEARGGGGEQGARVGQCHGDVVYSTNFGPPSPMVQQVSGPNTQFFCAYEGGAVGPAGPPLVTTWSEQVEEEQGGENGGENMDTWTR